MYVDICEAGQRFFWCVTEGWESYPLAHGICDTFEEAEEKMWALGTMLARGRQIEDQVTKARQLRKGFPHYRGGAMAKDAKRSVWMRDNTKPTGEYLYGESMCEDGERVVREYEIVKKTRTKVYIRDNSGRLIGLNRQELESKGEVHSRRKSITTFYTQPYEIRCADKIADEKRRNEEYQAEMQMKRNAVTDDDLAKVRQIFDERMTGDLAVDMAYRMKKCGIL